MTLLEEIQTKCTAEEIAAGDFHVLAAKVSLNRVKPNTKEIGNGTILEKLGLTLGTTVLDIISTTPSYKYVIPLLEQGRLLIGTTIAQDAVQSFVTAAVLTQEQADSIKNIGLDPDPVGWEACRSAVQGV